MPFDFSFDFANQAAYVTATGTTDFTECLEAMVTLISDRRFSGHMRILVDLRNVDYAVSAEEVSKLVESPVWRAIIDGHQIAVVAGKAVQFGMTNVLAYKSEGTVMMEPFYSLEEALNWLGINRWPVQPVMAN